MSYQHIEVKIVAKSNQTTAITVSRKINHKGVQISCTTGEDIKFYTYTTTFSWTYDLTQFLEELATLNHFLTKEVNDGMTPLDAATLVSLEIEASKILKHYTVDLKVEHTNYHPHRHDTN